MEYNWWGSDCPDPKKFVGSVDYVPWLNASLDAVVSQCP
jgi:hypothetical protein